MSDAWTGFDGGDSDVLALVLFSSFASFLTVSQTRSLIGRTVPTTSTVAVGPKTTLRHFYERVGAVAEEKKKST